VINVTDMRRVLADRGILLTKSLGQNFLHDANQLRRIADAAQIAPTDSILEIGPGMGPLTEILLERAGHVFAIEMDRRFVQLLQETIQNPKLELLHADALDIVRDKTRDWSNWKLVANLPYSVASPILVELAENPNAPKSMTVTLQLEVAKRIQSNAGDEDYGVLTLLLQVRYEPRAFLRIPAECFFPAPEVDSACISLQRREMPLLSNKLLPKFKQIVKKAFSERRKMMMKLLKQEWPAESVIAAFEKIGLSPQIRAERVSLAEFVRLTSEL